MTKVTKEENWGTSDVINIQTENGNFYISFEKNLNLYFSYLGNNIENQNDSYSFIIDKENRFLYEQIDRLHDAIMSQRPYKNSESLNKDYGHSHINLKKPLLREGAIEWHSDDSSYDVSSVLSIKKEEDDFLITFKKSQDDEFNRNAYRVCIKNGGSRYDPYNVSFMVMYNNLRSHNFEMDRESDKVKVRTR